MNRKQQIKKQLTFATSLLEEIKVEYAKKSLKFGKSAYEDQLKEVNRLRNLMKTAIIILSLFLVGCDDQQTKLDKDVKNMFEFIECPFINSRTNNLSPSASN